VTAWRDALAGLDAAPFAPWLSEPGARAAWQAALDPLPALDGLAPRPIGTVAVVGAATVFTAPLEVVAAALSLGGRALWKYPKGRPGAALAVASLEARVTATSDRAALEAADRIVVLGSDATVAAVRAAARSDQVVLGFGHRFSAAWLIGDDWRGLAFDLAMHDGRGCLSPSVVLTPRADGVSLLAQALEDAEARWPAGARSPEEAARVRVRSALARVVGEVREGPWGAVHRVPADLLNPVALPRAPLLVQVDDVAAAHAALAPFARWLSTVATDDATISSWAGASAVVAPGQLQRPTIPRVWDGRPWPDALWETPPG
jgi:hypothetical protein